VSTNFYLVRHAIKEKGVGDVAISPEGILQAQTTARHFRHMPIKVIMTSPLKRAKETALLIAKEAKTTISEDIRLRERANWGDIPEQKLFALVALTNYITLHLLNTCCK
jgi:broad specificity phosphatase PhoE